MQKNRTSNGCSFYVLTQVRPENKGFPYSGRDSRKLIRKSSSTDHDFPYQARRHKAAPRMSQQNVRHPRHHRGGRFSNIEPRSLLGRQKRIGKVCFAGLSNPSPEGHERQLPAFRDSKPPECCNCRRIHYLTRGNQLGDFLEAEGCREHVLFLMISGGIARAALSSCCPDTAPAQSPAASTCSLASGATVAWLQFPAPSCHHAAPQAKQWL